MDDSLLVRFVHGGANLFENIERPSDGEIFLLLEYLAERTSVEILHRQVGGPAVRRFCEAEVRYIDDVGVAETTCSPSFAAKAFDKFGTLHELWAITLTATGRSVPRWVARYTVPIPPRP